VLRPLYAQARIERIGPASTNLHTLKPARIPSTAIEDQLQCWLDLLGLAPKRLVVYTALLVAQRLASAFVCVYVFWRNVLLIKVCKLLLRKLHTFITCAQPKTELKTEPKTDVCNFLFYCTRYFIGR
jgi:hypothetical protein